MINELFNNLNTKFSKVNELRKKKTIVFVICTMRSGSTLLKSLLANAPDTSHLPEIDFQKYTIGNQWKMKTLSPARIVILKKPAPYHAANYPSIPKIKNARKLILIRDVYDTVLSLKKMNKSISAKLDSEWTLEKLVQDYWIKTYRGLFNELPLSNEDYKIINYENLVEFPIRQTQEIFKFIGSSQQTGVDEYLPAKNFKWEWGKDDGGEKIQSLKVQNIISKKDNLKLIEIINNSPEIDLLRKRLGYHNSIVS